MENDLKIIIIEPLNQNKMEIIHLINDTYQVVNKDGTIVFQGKRDECQKYFWSAFIQKI